MKIVLNSTVLVTGFLGDTLFGDSRQPTTISNSQLGKSSIDPIIKSV